MSKISKLKELVKEASDLESLAWNRFKISERIWLEQAKRKNVLKDKLFKLQEKEELK